MKVTADFNGTQRLDESNLYMIANPDTRRVEFGENNRIEDCVWILEHDEAYLLYQMLEKSLVFLHDQK